MKFEYPLDLHCSQTIEGMRNPMNSLNTLWIYTALKPAVATEQLRGGLNTLWIYTALKQRGRRPRDPTV